MNFAFSFFVVCVLPWCCKFVGPSRGSSAAGAGQSWVRGTGGGGFWQDLGGNGPAAGALIGLTPLPQPLIAFEQFKPDYLLWGALRPSFASASTPAGCVLQLIHGLDEGARDAKSQSEKSNKQRAAGFITRLLF
jgi:hypothetical protein